jgi:hypothetical protein
MSSQPNKDIVKWFCDLLGREHVLSEFLDWVARWLVPLPRIAYGLADGPTFRGHPSERPGHTPHVELIHMASGPGTEGEAPLAPTTPHDVARGRAEEPNVIVKLWRQLWGTTTSAHRADKVEAGAHAKAACAEAKYHGMHGRPCKFTGGSDTKCPPGTVSGWFWRYDTPAGVIYYVDCCGGPIQGAHNVWCNWSDEQNWCLGPGRSASRSITDYNCTLAIPSDQMTVVTAPDGHLEVFGVDP